MKRIVILFCSLGCFSQSYAQSWLQTNGPGGNGINALAIDSPGDIFAVSNSIMKSTDNGVSWHQIAAQIPNPVNIQIKPSGEIFVIENDYGDYYELWRSTDNGNTWKRLQFSLRTTFLSFLSDGSIAITATPDYKSHYFISTDTGTSWSEEIPIGIEGIPQQLWSDKAGHFFLGTDAYVYRSIDSGKNWSKIVNGITWGISTFAEAPNGHLFASVTNASAGGFPSIIVKSTDGGRVWEYITVEREYNPSQVFQIVVSSQGRVAILSDDKFVVSDDDGNTWRNINGLPFFSHILFVDKNNQFYFNSGSSVLRSSLDTSVSYRLFPVPNGTINTIIKHPGGNLLAMSNGLWISKDDGNTWTAQNGGGSPLALDSLKNLLAGNNGGITRSTDSGLTWKSDNKPLTSGVITGINVRNKGEIFISSSTEGIFRSIDNGLTWDQLNVGITNQQLFSLAVHQNGDVYAGSHNAIFKSTDVGLHWTQLNTNFPSNSGNVTSLVVSTQGNIIAGIENTGVFWSADDGGTWSQKGTGLIANRINALVSTPSGKVFAATDNGIFFLDILPGVNWIKLNSGLTATNILSLCRDQSGRLYAGTDVSGVFRSTQTFNLVGQAFLNGPQLISPYNGSSDSSVNVKLLWNSIAGAKNYQVTISEVKDFSTVDTVSDLLTDTSFTFDTHLSTGLSLYWHVQAINEAEVSPFSETWSFQIEIPNGVINSSSNSPETVLSDNYPNPFSSSTTIPFTIGKSDYISLEIADMLGRKIAILANGNYIAGSYEVKFNSGDLPGGVYFVRLQTESQSYTRPIVVAK